MFEKSMNDFNEAIEIIEPFLKTIPGFKCWPAFQWCGINNENDRYKKMSLHAHTIFIINDVIQKC